MLNHQHGIGLIEVLVALLLLSVAVLGFSAMQMRAIKATDETLLRSDAMVVVRNISEDMRLHAAAGQKQEYSTYIQNYTSGTSAPRDCRANNCTNGQRAQYNAHQALSLAAQSNISIGVANCPRGTTANQTNIQKTCLIASWEGTQATFSTANTNACADDNGVYKPGANCIVMETY